MGQAMETGRSQSSWKQFRRLFPFLGRHRKWLWLLWGVAAVLGALDFIYPYFLKTMTDSMLNRQYAAFGRLVEWALLLMSLDVVLKFAQRIVAVRYRSRTMRDLRARLAAHIQRLPISYSESVHSGDLVSRLNNDLDRVGTLLEHIDEVVGQPVVFVLGFSYLYLLSWKLLLATCILIPISAVLHNRVVKPMQAHSRKELVHLARANAVTQDAIRGIYIIKAFNLQGLLTEKFRRIADDVQAEGLAIDRRRAVELAVFLMLRYIPQLVAPLYGGYLAFTGEITAGALIACNYLIWMVFLPVETGLRWARELRELAPAVERVFEVFEQAPEPQDGEPPRWKPGAPALAFEAVGFHYSEEAPVLDDFSFSLDSGRIAALVGPSGCGKSTVLRLLCGFYRPQAGRVLIAGNDLFQSNLQELRRFVSLVSQDVYLFPASLAENISYGRRGATREEIVAAARAANADEFIRALPDGYETQAGEWGVRLSGGERQRISLARAILKDAPILLLDEPTSALDAQSEAFIQQALERFMVGRTVLVVAHRLATVRHADEIVVLQSGRLQERGTHELLMASDTLYRRLYLNQASLEAMHVDTPA